MATDIAMSMLLPVLMAYSLVGEEVHEWLGIVMLLLFIIHHILNWGWYKNFGKGTYTPIRILSTGINLLLVIIMVALPVSGILMAKHTFRFIRFSSGIASVNGFSASLQGFLCGCFKPAAAGNLHPQDGNIFYIVIPYYCRQFLAVVNGIKFWATDQCNFSLHKILMDIRISICSTVSSNQQ